ncbi:hypothetical protein CDL15_Pgr004728 [Punica granatum]|uniref:Potassium channel tetramerisation-type BTB domain-containing protein n=1 Tax=Punica granatum TaxID=22663 RepID=A0A218W6H9_PUNGR|nr:hypothetical protein CDL15_Pgr004728 [Punica granatum]
MPARKEKLRSKDPELEPPRKRKKAIRRNLLYRLPPIPQSSGLLQVLFLRVVDSSEIEAMPSLSSSFPTLALSGGSTGLYQSKPELNIVTIDVGGQIFQTTKQTLALAGPSSLLSDSDPSQLATVFGPPSKCADLSSSASVSHAITVNTLRRNFLSHFMGS